MNFDRWQKLMFSFGFGENKKTFNALLAAYSQKHRHYHTGDHIDACLRHLDGARHLASSAREIELALWFHDSIYVPRKSNNELNSANWAKTFLTQNAAEPGAIDRIFNLIMATLHNASVYSSDEFLLVDIDLSVLGSPPSMYDEFERAVRMEYRWVPYFLYKKKRKEVLKSFFDRDRIYNHAHFYESFEDQAKINLENAIGRL